MVMPDMGRLGQARNDRVQDIRGGTLESLIEQAPPEFIDYLRMDAGPEFTEWLARQGVDLEELAMEDIGPGVDDDLDPDVRSMLDGLESGSLGPPPSGRPGRGSAPGPSNRMPPGGPPPGGPRPPRNGERNGRPNARPGGGPPRRPRDEEDERRGRRR